jgi:hypothetical protein
VLVTVNSATWSAACTVYSGSEARRDSSQYLSLHEPSDDGLETAAAGAGASESSEDVQPVNSNARTRTHGAAVMAEQ